jgi:hypothetical protein
VCRFVNGRYRNEPLGRLKFGWQPSLHRKERGNEPLGRLIQLQVGTGQRRHAGGIGVQETGVVAMNHWEG